MIFTIIEAILPIFLVIFIGWAAGKNKIIEFEHKKSLINFVTKISLPLLLLDTTSKTPIKHFADFKVLSVIILGLTLLFFTTYFIFKLFFKVNLNKSAISAITSSFPNATFMGIPILIKLYGQSAMTIIIMFGIVASILLISLTVIIIETHRNKDVHPFKHILKILNTPMIIAPVMGLFLSYLNLGLPKVLHSTFFLIGNTAPAIALFIIGFSISNSKLAMSRQIGLMIFIKSIVTPLVFWGLLVLFNIKGEVFKQVLLISAIPTATIGPMLASQYEAYEIESNSVSIIGTILSIVTLGIIIYLIS